MDALQKDIREKISHTIHTPFAIFDFDNTCITNDVGEATFAYVCKNKLLKDKTLIEEKGDSYYKNVFCRYYELLDQGKTKEAYMLCARMFSRFTPQEAEQITIAAMEEEGEEISTSEVFGRTVMKGLAVRPPVLSLMHFLESLGIHLWIITGSPEIVVHTAMEYFDIKQNLIGVRSVVKGNIYTTELHTPMPIIEGKVDCMRTFIDSTNAPLLVVDDSMTGIKLLETAQIKVVVTTRNGLTKEAQKRGWHIL